MSLDLLSGSCSNLEPVFLVHAQNFGDGISILLLSGAEVASPLPAMLHHLRSYDVCLGTARIMCNGNNTCRQMAAIQQTDWV